MNLGQMRPRLRTRVGNPSTTDVADSVLTQNINDALIEIAEKYRFRVMWCKASFSSVVGQTSYGIDATAEQIADVWDRTNNRLLSSMTPTEFAFRDDANAAQGRPERYLRFGNYVRLFPPPDGVYEIAFYWKKPAPTILVVDADEPEIPPAWHRGLLLLATYYYFSDISRSAQKAVAAYNEYTAWLKDKPVEVWEEKKYEQPSVRLPTLEQRVPKSVPFENLEP